MVFSQLEYWYQGVVFQLLKQIVPFLRWITLPAVYTQIDKFLYKTDKAPLQKASVTLSITGFIGIHSQAYSAFSFALSCFFCTAVSLFALSANGPDSFLLTSFLNFYFLIALPFFLFFMFMGVLFVFLFYGCNVFLVFVCFKVLACFMFLQ